MAVRNIVPLRVKEKRVPLLKKGTIWSNSTPGAPFWYPFFSECKDMFAAHDSIIAFRSKNEIHLRFVSVKEQHELS